MNTDASADQASTSDASIEEAAARRRAIAEIERVDALATHHATPCGDGTMAWREWGSGPAVALLHGGFGSWLHWIRNVEALSERYRILACDIPGLGDSAGVPESGGPQAIGATVAAGLATLLGDTDSVHLVGFSFGGLISGRAALALGPRCRAFTLVGASGLGLIREPLEMLRRTPDMSAAARAAALHHNLRALMLHHDRNVDPLAMEIQARNDARARVRSRRFSLGADLAESLPDIQATVSGVWGEHDRTATPRLDERRKLLLASHPETDFRVIPDAGHWVSYEAPATFNSNLLSLLDASAV